MIVREMQLQKSMQRPRVIKENYFHYDSWITKSVKYTARAMP
jgi:hypothetical protein